MASKETNNWFVYMVRCSDGTLYTGITTELQRRINEHNSPQLGARYTRARQPVQLVYSQAVENRSKASKTERKIKKMPLKKKEILIQEHAITFTVT